MLIRRARFEVKRGMASGIAFVGSSVGGIAFPLILKPAFEHLSWAWAVRLIALIVLVMMTAGNLCIRGRLPPRKNGGTVDLRCFQDARFSWATIGVACEFKYLQNKAAYVLMLALPRFRICTIWSTWNSSYLCFRSGVQYSDQLQHRRRSKCVSEYILLLSFKLMVKQRLGIRPFLLWLLF